MRGDDAVGISMGRDVECEQKDAEVEVKSILFGIFGFYLRKSNLKIENRVVNQRSKSHVGRLVTRCQCECVHSVIYLDSFRINCESCRRR